MKMNNKVPPIIEQYITNMNNRDQNIHIRNNYKVMLENIIEVCQKEVALFNAEYSKKVYTGKK